MVAKRVIFLMNGWDSAVGGIQTVNRELIVALARLRPELNCTAIVTAATSRGRDHAFRNGVDLISGDTKDVWANVVLSPELAKIDADEVLAIVGHSRFSGDVSLMLRDRFFPNAIAAHFIHMNPMRIESEKEGKQDKFVGEREEKLRVELGIAKQADLVFCVGPRLARYMHDQFFAHDLPVDKIRRIDCGISADQKPRSGTPAEPTVLCLGRTESLKVKGLDIFAYVAGLIHARWDQNPLTKDLPHKPRFVVRGAEKEPEKLEAHLKILAHEVGGSPTIQVRPYTALKEDLTADLRGATAILMPSREEGFGLVACEATSIGTPILISSASGIADLIKEIGATTALAIGHCIIDVDGDPKAVAQRFADATIKLLVNGAHEEVAYALLRGHLASVCSWDKGAQTFIEAVEAAAVDKPAIKPKEMHPVASDAAPSAARTIEDVVAAERERLLAKEGVVGVGVKQAIVVTIVEGSKPNIPREMEGYQVVVREVGDIQLTSSGPRNAYALLVNGQQRATIGLFATDFSGSLYAITVAHAFDRTELISTEMKIGDNLVPLSIESLDATSDWALLRVPHGPLSPSPRASGRPASGDRVDIELAGRVVSGTVDTIEMTLDFGVPAGERRRYDGAFEVVVPHRIDRGSSGSVVSGKNGEVLGVLIATARRGAEEDIALVRSVTEFLDRNSLSPAMIDELPGHPRIGILLANDDAASELMGRLKGVTRFTRSNRFYFRGTTDSGTTVVFSIMRDFGGISAGIAMTALLVDNKVDATFVLGTCGGLRSDLSVGDVVVSSDVLLFENGNFGFKVDHIRPYAFGITSNELQSLAREIAMDWRGFRTHVGRIASLSASVATNADLTSLARLSRDILAIEMNCGGATRAAMKIAGDIPVVVVAGVSEMLSAEKADRFPGAMANAVDTALRIIARLRISGPYKKRVLSVATREQPSGDGVVSY